MACHTTTNCQDTLGSFHTSDIFRRCLKTNKYDFLAAGIPLFCIFCSKYDFTTSSSWRSTKCFCHWSSSFQCSCIKLWMKKGIEVTRIDHSNCFFLCSHSFIYQITSDLQSSLSCSLTVTCLKHVQFSVFYSKLHVLHVSVVIFKCSANLFKLSECFWEFLLHLSDRHRCTNAGNNVFTLCILKEFSHQFLLSCSRVTSKCNTCTTVITHVTKCHGLYVYSSSPRIRDVVVTTVYICTWVVP